MNSGQALRVRAAPKPQCQWLSRARSKQTGQLQVSPGFSNFVGAVPVGSADAVSIEEPKLAQELELAYPVVSTGAGETLPNWMQESSCASHPFQQSSYCLKTTGGPLTRLPLRSTVTSTRSAIFMKGMPLFIP